MFINSEQIDKRKLSYRMLVLSQVALQGSFTKAAAELGHTKSAISAYISELELMLGHRLLNRSTRRLSLTPVGERFIEYCHGMDDLMRRGLDELRALDDVPSGRVAITAPHAFEDDIIGPVIAELCQQYPELEPEIIFSDERLDLLQNKLDLAITVGELSDSNYRAIPLGEMNSILVCSPKWQHHHKVEDIEQLSDIKRITPNWRQDFILENIHDKQRFDLKGGSQIVVNTLTAVISMCIMGSGSALVPEVFVRKALQEGKLIQLLPDWQGETRPIYAVHAYEKQLPFVLRLLVEGLRERL
ncbi:LysR family transcriptional regulator [uncultured Pseudoteredinibacter sp.]|uniref:LysR family transcriptional regulator n=1 Tax=uncultured Pseudoteredinibacter sp. TaxID=1641701 RepID=UPI00261CC249|nr:LysR family transcriptional regulator [uncultured Pseudoteredinibacter sp.]